MLISYEKGMVNIDGFESFESNGNTYYYSGIIWMRGKKAGKESMQEVATIYEGCGTIPFIKIFGSFYCVIQRENGEIILFTDNSNMHCYYMGRKAIGTNYLEVIRENGANEFNNEALCELFVLGGVYFGKTLVHEIELTEFDKYYICSRGAIRVENKNIGGIDDKTSIIDVNVFLKEMAYALSDLKVTLSLTGGYDSRMIYACFKGYIPIDVFISGDNEKDADISCSRNVAKAAGSQIEIIKTLKPNITEEYIKSLFEYAQGIVPFINDGYIRVSEFVKNRAEKGYDCYLTGDGGVMHKDWWWIQDIPFYKKKTVNFNKFYFQRIQYTRESVPWGIVLEEQQRLLREKIIKELMRFKMPSNTQTYDTLYFNVNGKKISSNYSIHSNYICSYAPLWELDLVRYSYHLPRRKRFFYSSMRNITTKASKDIARVPTNYGTTASSEPLYICRDVFFQGIDYFKKACRMMSRKVFNKNFFVGNPVTWSAELDVRRLPIAQKALDYAIENGLIKDGIKLDDISYTLLGRLVQVFMLAQFMNS